MEKVEEKTQQKGLYGQMANDVDLINQITPLGRMLIKKIERIVYSSHGDDGAMLKEAVKYTHDLKVSNPQRR